MIINTNEDYYAGVMEEAFMRVTNNKLKPEIASYFSKKISLTIDYSNPHVMHRAPSSRAIDFAKRFKNECFIDGVNPLRK